jgi:hypothetical protein
MSKRATLAEKLLHRLNAKIDALVAAREELLEEIEVTTKKPPVRPADAPPRVR